VKHGPHWIMELNGKWKACIVNMQMGATGHSRHQCKRRQVHGKYCGPVAERCSGGCCWSDQPIKTHWFMPLPPLSKLPNSITSHTIKSIKSIKSISHKMSSTCKTQLKDKAQLDKELEKVEQLNIENTSKKAKFDRNSLESIMIKRFFYAPSFSIYGGVAGLFDYGPVGCSLQNNIIEIWRKHFIIQEDMLEVDCTNLTLDQVLKTSGHVERFADYMVKDVLTGDIFRADHLIKSVIQSRLDAQLDDNAKPLKDKKDKQKDKQKEKVDETTIKEYTHTLNQLDNYTGKELGQLIQKLDICNPETGNKVTEPVMFNLMFETSIGPTGYLKGYLRPETAQGQFVNFSRLLEFNNNKLPFASASIGKSFRNEISPRAGLLRVREFTMAEIEHFVDPLNKLHPRFNTVKDLSLTLLPKQNQLDGSGTVEMTLEDAVSKGIIDNETLGYFIGRINLFLLKIGINPSKLRFRQHMDNEMAHYACDCWDAEIETSYGWIECVGCADRSAYDLTVHSKKTGARLSVQVMLEQPLIKTALVLTLNKTKLGQTFKKEAKLVQNYFDGFLDSKGDWDQQEMMRLKMELESGGIKVVLPDASVYELSKDFISIDEKTEKINGTFFVCEREKARSLDLQSESSN
jgi:glycyl-tRNA synthetase